MKLLTTSYGPHRLMAMKHVRDPWNRMGPGNDEEAMMEDEEIYEEFTCWVCDAVATPIYDEEGNIIGNHCRARCDDPGC